ncbi:hypothetical protein Y1Q_0005074 [Alligator mississippiensis]|uniref:Uncharacterized protein n=1 Tax=Alligator mississippiensis TaxID=8496 RepID=A0A151MUB2_ALLMI|nr:hypothetical protein Y1Q_0005074 [Alligator mississippiensis]
MGSCVGRVTSGPPVGRGGGSAALGWSRGGDSPRNRLGLTFCGTVAPCLRITALLNCQGCTDNVACGLEDGGSFFLRTISSLDTPETPLMRASMLEAVLFTAYLLLLSLG